MDAAGRRRSLVLPTALANDSLVYVYDAQRGILREITQGSRRVHVSIDRAGRQDSLVISRLVSGAFVAGVIERRAYDDDDQLRWRERKRGTGEGIITDSVSYDARGRMRRVWSSSAATEVGLRTITNAYAGMGAVVASEENKGGAWWEAEQYRTNALGQIWFSRTDKGATATPYPQRTHYNHNGAVVARQPLRADPADTVTFDDTTYAHIDQAGNITRSGSRSRFEGADSYVAVRNYYRSDNRLAVVQRYSANNAGRDGAWEEFRYDALGRKVLSRIRREGGGVYTALCSGDCVGTVERTIWDGDNILYELRVDGSDARSTTQLDALTSVGPNWGKAGYLHFGGIDQPVMLFDGRVPNYDWRGMPESSSWADGTPADCAMGTGTCTVINWPAGTSVYYKKFSWATGPSTPPQWVGSLLANGAGGTGLLYRRNRYYNPATGQFTQQDPIGIAGGLSVYGYAGGDPLNYSDPFGAYVRIRNERVRRAVNRLRAMSPTFAAAYDALHREPASRVNIVVRMALPEERGCFGARADRKWCAVRTYERRVPTPDGRILYGEGEDDPITESALLDALMHEFIHAAGQFSEFTGVPNQCGDLDEIFGMRNPCLREWEHKMSREMQLWWNSNPEQEKKDKPKPE